MEEHGQLAQRLSALSFEEARREIRHLDPDADMKFFRNSYWDEYHTLFLLPNRNLSITLVEKSTVETTNRRDYSGPKDRKRQKVAYNYIEARVSPLQRPAAKF